MESFINDNLQTVFEEEEEGETEEAVPAVDVNHVENDLANNNADENEGDRSVFDALIDLLPFEMNFPGMEFCGPGSHLEERLDRGEQGVNLLDKACLQHDLVYASKNKDRRKADRVLADKAFSRMLSFDAEPDERTAALVTACCMISKITFEKFFERIQKAIGLNKKKKKKNIIPDAKKKQIRVVHKESKVKKTKKNKKKKDGKNFE